MMKYKFRGIIMKEFIRLRKKKYLHLTDDDKEGNRAKVKKKCIINFRLKLDDYKNCLRSWQIKNMINYLEEQNFDVDKLKKKLFDNSNKDSKVTNITYQR